MTLDESAIRLTGAAFALEDTGSIRMDESFHVGVWAHGECAQGAVIVAVNPLPGAAYALRIKHRGRQEARDEVRRDALEALN